MKAMYKGFIITAGILVAVLTLVTYSQAQSHEGFMFGKIYTDRAVYTGPIRWGKEEVLWTDFFNASKTENGFEKMVPEKNTPWFSYDWDFTSIWENTTIHQFTCQFGNIKEFDLSGRKVKLKLKNGMEVKVDDSGNDIGEEIQIFDAELGIISIGWSNINRIEFLSTPLHLKNPFGIPLYGTVEGARKEKYTGFIIWDNEERLSIDKLDGESDDGDLSLLFRDITSIEKRGRGSEVNMKSGRSVYLTGTNDVNSENRGVWVVTPDFGIVNFTWNAFRKVTFSLPPDSGPAYNTFAAPKKLTGVVSRLNDSDVTGEIIYDIDEFLDFEILEGSENDIEYNIPLKQIRKVTPRNSEYAEVELISGKTLLLGGGRDVSAKNSGVLVFQVGKKEPLYIPWKQVNHITFN